MRSATGGLMLSLTLFACSMFASPSDSATTCASLTSLSLPDTTITLAQSYTAGETVSGTRHSAGRALPGGGNGQANQQIKYSFRGVDTDGRKLEWKISADR